jgi:hypothetical protein
MNLTIRSSDWPTATATNSFGSDGPQELTDRRSLSALAHKDLTAQAWDDESVRKQSALAPWRSRDAARLLTRFEFSERDRCTAGADVVFQIGGLCLLGLDPICCAPIAEAGLLGQLTDGCGTGLVAGPIAARAIAVGIFSAMFA